MALIAMAGSEGKVFTPAPAGPHQAVCVDVIDKGMHPNKFNPGKDQHKIDIAWQIDERRDDGKPYLVYKRYTLSLHEKATLRHDLESWRGAPFMPDAGFDVESIIGANCLINIQHNTVGDRTYANVVSVMPLVKGMAKLKPEGYERKSAPPVDIDQPNTPITDEDIPF